MSGIVAWRGHALLALPMRIYLGVVFIVACLHKIADPGAFALDVATYDLLPLSLINAMAIVLPWVELVAGVLLVVGFRTRAAAFLIAGMMVMFIVAVIWAVAAVVYWRRCIVPTIVPPPVAHAPVDHAINTRLSEAAGEHAIDEGAEPVQPEKPPADKPSDDSTEGGQANA